jgi:ribosome recycling factor
MPEDDFDIDVDDLQRRMDGAMVSLKTEFASLRTGRATRNGRCIRSNDTH